MSVLTDQDRENIIRLVKDGKSLPEHYRTLLFPDEREYAELTRISQLVYKGKKSKEEVIAETPAAPLQEVRSFNADAAGAIISCFCRPRTIRPFLHPSGKGHIPIGNQA